MILFPDLQPLSASERKRYEARRVKLDKSEVEVGKACGKFAEVETGKRLRVRSGFLFREDPAELPGDPSDRRLPPPQERPPATRLPSPRGIALKAYLTALFVAQAGSPGTYPGNALLLSNVDSVSWVDLFATPSELTRTGDRNYITVRDKKVRQLQSALDRLSADSFQLVHLPNGKKVRGRYEVFQLLHENGVPYGGGDNPDRYMVPPEQDDLPWLPAGLFRNGWIHLLEDTEINFLLVLAWMHAKFGDQPVFIPSDIRLRQFGLGRDAYEAHRMLDRFGLVDVEEDPDRHFDNSRVTGFKEGTMPKLHRFELRREGFNEQALPKIRSAIERRLG
ncbi:hypothetical protein AB0M61_12995 [Streptomyces sp. NPDC051642]|uniref:hypothetical protein n=1 Tax=Streptomyces sp. NPDC051642 TaxID=3154646 RepID=UPI003442BD79